MAWHDGQESRQQESVTFAPGLANYSRCRPALIHQATHVDWRLRVGELLLAHPREFSGLALVVAAFTSG